MTTERILVVGPSWVGDMVMAQSLFKILKTRFLSAEIDVLAPEWSLPILARMPEVRRGVPLPVGHGELGVATRRRIGRSLRQENYRRAIVLPRSFKAALVPWFAGIPERTGFRGEMRFGLINDMRAFDRDALDMTVKRFAALGLDAGAPVDELPDPVLTVDADAQAVFAARHDLGGDGPAIAMMPGAEYGPAKCWPIEKFSELARRLTAAGARVWVLGSDKDVDAGARVAAASGAKNLCGKTSLSDVVDVLGLAEQAVSNDSGLMHVAAAAGCHVHGIYGSSSPSFTPPLTREKTIHTLELACSPCFERRCPLGHTDCLNKLDVDRVFAAIERAAVRQQSR
jgi:heptosyltransferase-2